MKRSALQSGFARLFDKLKKLEGNPTESRSFMYLDILSWLESKIKNVPVQDIISARYQERSLQYPTP